ncbi:uncharacterized protein LOC105184733 isoform X2 [Harpegnathos saltator]|uniref:Uncharacterized protein n=2 Tax=Harpegnathos saltator TaxID=610380 RepID=E2BN89_HARSA|nr:uncharacterized protein LOC105184733 isoform X2 [Harpegnathos saltator]XP_011141999.1 uncharacterized protein LOC105184733 isoform X2 [Harpegnathos saltator]XP_025154530.1 uncharacterized protein LOC105184733 isoform X2 [Harpegnathos saltator]EFN82851.1 hypothetical protein EAI_07295 [Harpegnathos saltator]
MHPTCATLYAVRLTLNQVAAPTFYRKSMVDRSTTRSAIFLATVGLSLSMFSLKQMQSSSNRRHQHHLQRA